MKKVLVIAMAALSIMGMTSCSGNRTSSEETTDMVTSADSVEIKDNLTLGREFLAENAKNDSVVQTESGLQYMVHYTGKLIDGTVFDSSVERGEPATFPLDKVIPGWTEGLQLMSEGSEYRLFIPSELAYGSKGAGDKILPNATLIFDVQLIKVDKQK